MVTISDVAAHAGVGAGTVSRVLNASPQVSATTRARVLAAIEALDYRPNPLARGLSLGRCQTIGVVVPFFTHASAVERLRGVVDALHGSTYDLVLFNVESALHRDEHFAALTGRARADGLLVMSMPPTSADLERLRRSGVPVVLVDARGDGVPCVVTDDVEGGRIATRHLVALGHQRIAFIGGEAADELGFAAADERERGYVEVLRDAGLPTDVDLRGHGPHDRVAARALAEQLLALDPRPTAVFASSDVQAIGVLEAARVAGLRVPDDLSIVGFDDIEVAGYVSLTTVRQPLFASGKLGADLLLDALYADEPGSAEVRELPLELVERATTAPPQGVAA
jgi:LacI family transcriptional regulator